MNDENPTDCCHVDNSICGIFFISCTHPVMDLKDCYFSVANRNEMLKVQKV